MSLGGRLKDLAKEARPRSDAPTDYDTTSYSLSENALIRSKAPALSDSQNCLLAIPSSL